MNLHISRFIYCLIALGGLSPVTSRGADDGRIKGDAPPNTVALREAPGGAYFVTRSLKEEYDKLLTRVRALEADLDADRVAGPQVVSELNDLKPKLDQLRTEIEQKKVLVSPLKMHTQVEETSFDLSPERLLVVTGRRVKVEGWSGTQVKCVLTKTVFTTGDQPVDDSMAAIKLVHRQGMVPAVLKLPRAEYQGEDLSPFTTFEGKTTDTVGVEGLDGRFNEQLYVDIKSAGGGSFGHTEWPLHTDLTIYMPDCKALALRNCSEVLEAKGIHGAMLLVGRGGPGPDDTSVIRDLTGPLISAGITPTLVENVRGDVTITARLGTTSELLSEPMTPSGVRGVMRKVYTDAPQAMTLRNISGDVTTRLLQTNLNLEGIGGRVDVLNNFGSTNWTIGAPLAEKAHRIVSQSGRVELQLNSKVLGSLPVEALSNCGFVRFEASFAKDSFQSAMASLGSEYGAARDWRGWESPRKNPSESATAARLKAILEGKDRSPGLDLISHCGSVLLHYEN